MRADLCCLIVFLLLPSQTLGSESYMVRKCRHIVAQTVPLSYMAVGFHLQIHSLDALLGYSGTVTMVLWWTQRERSCMVFI